MTVNSATARYEGLGKEGKGHVTSRSGAIDAPYGFATRFEDAPGTNPEEMIAAAHASCFTMATSFALAKAGHSDGSLETECKVTLVPADGGFKVTKSELSLKGKVSGLSQDEFEAIAAEAKAGCPISKLLNCEITLTTSFEG
ncbi:osmotically inducible protein OsmC [Novosphingobium chloroacetimidivorans]|uniref:Osmotically inducible protein OsmC n=1 Tax=Novosphingobium chloroacetimidivorans TaxID=1428314 RepID=A0A7W7NVU7_9SPHN|nr:OsmC family protein [Novosphingobium chloroacetimidivorans]MBB4857497.1 osmotically inducible protein OsmC [Novosphingobium chloroacetimidivorans]